jgi:small GTP-binding protein
MALNMQMGAVPKMKLKVCMVGDSGVGKTSLVRRYVMDFFDDRYIVTLGTKITKKRILVKDNPLGTPIEVTITLWDIMGQESFRELLKESYFYGANGLIAVMDVTDAGTLISIRRWIDLAQGVAGRVPVHLVVNKIDLKERATILPDDVANTARELNATWGMTSAKTGERVEDAFQSLANAIVQNRFTKDLGLRLKRP